MTSCRQIRLSPWCVIGLVVLILTVPVLRTQAGKSITPAAIALSPNGDLFVLDLVDELKTTGQAVNSWRLGEHTIAKTVCRHAVKAHDPLAGAELEKLLDDLRHCAMPYTCPHGRPTLIEMNFRELDKRFGRVT